MRGGEVNRQFFGTDGIRDVAGQGCLGPDHVVAYGQALGVWLHRRKPQGRILIGRDTRASGPRLLDQLAPGLLLAGHTIVDGGVLPTPAVQLLCREEGFDLAIVISASHNPAEDNGLKFFGPDGRKLPNEAEVALEALTVSALHKTLDAPAAIHGGGRMRDPEAGARYIDDLERRFKDLDLSGQRIVLDCAHGAASSFAPKVLEQRGASLWVRGAEPDGTNINRGVGVFHVAELGAYVREQKAVLGMALDGDADRVLLVDETGVERDGDHLLGLFARDLLARGLLTGDRLVTTVMANLGLKVFLEGLGVVCDMVPVGDRFVSAEMAETGAAVGGEQSGHIIFQEDQRWTGDGLFTALRVLEVMGRTGESLSALTRGIEKFPQVLVNVRVREKPPVDSVDELVRAKDAAERDLGSEGRVVLRYSGTEPLLRVMVEGRDIDRVQGHVDAMVAVARRVLGAPGA
jgi:phosphoglucosamine mutase